MPDRYTDMTLTDAFKDLRLTISADTSGASVSLPIVVTTAVTPLLRAKGRFQLRGWCAKNGGVWILESPFPDTLVAPEALHKFLPVEAEFTAQTEAVQRWTIRLQNHEIYYITARAIMDSVFVEDSARYYYIKSRTAKNHSPDKEGYDNHAIPVEELRIDLSH